MTTTDKSALLNKQIEAIHEAQNMQIQLSGHANAYVIYRYVGTGVGAPAFQSCSPHWFRDHVRHEDNEIVATVLTSGEVLYPDTILGGA